MSVTTKLGVCLEVASCCGAEFAFPLLHKMQHGYEVCAAQPIPEDLEQWRAEHRTARKRAQRSRNKGYRADVLEREWWAPDIHDINVSKQIRQKRPMAGGYLEFTEYSPLPEFDCDRHAIRTSGVWTGELLVAYLVMYRVGELALVSQILGHGEHERFDVMFLLFEFALEREIKGGDGMVVYNRWDSGTPGLREFKTRLGFRETPIEWLP